jgi:hypothetical protein
MDTLTMIVGVCFAALVCGIAARLMYLQRKGTAKDDKTDIVDKSSKTLQLQAYERLLLLTNRMALPNVVSRVNVPEIGARDMQMLLLQAIREEFDYNITQQIYVSPAAWDAIKNLKEQNMLAVNQIAASLPANATGIDLNRRILEYVMTDQRGNLHELVAEALSFEAKKLL